MEMKGAGFVPPTFGNYDDLTLDSCFHLLRLYCARDHSLERSLDPATSVPFHLDYRIRYISLLTFPYVPLRLWPIKLTTYILGV